MKFNEKAGQSGISMRKPNPQIYLEALKEANLVPEETLFIDDMEENIEVAKTIILFF